MKKIQRNTLQQAIAESKVAFRYVFLFSFAANILILGLPIYTLQVLDRVVSSGSMETLTMLTILMIFIFTMLGAFTAVRSFVLIRMGKWLDKKLTVSLAEKALASAASKPGSSGSQVVRDVISIKQFLTGQAMIAAFDAPWAVVFLIVLFMIHPLTGTVALAGVVILVAITWLNERTVRVNLAKANEDSVQSLNQLEMFARNAEVVEALGMRQDIIGRWSDGNDEVVRLQAVASQREAIISAIAKAFRMILQILIVAVGAWLVLQNQLTIGSIIAGSILVGRVLAPFEMAIGAWGQVAGMRVSYDRLNKFINEEPDRDQAMSLPEPEGLLSVERVMYAIPGTGVAFIKGITLQMPIGQSLGIIGPSASGKSTLAKLIMGIYKPNTGNVRLDSADVYTWNRKDFGRHVGYLPQDVELFAGTVRDNIARMRPDATDEDVVAAAKITGAHEFILRLPNGYETDIGVGGAKLSGGQRQRIGLARAFFGNPKLVVLDEPNSNLDEVGENALMVALANAKEKKITTIVIAHRPAVLNFVDKVLVMRDGSAIDLGDPQDIMKKYSQQSQNAAAQAAVKKAGGKPAIKG